MVWLVFLFDSQPVCDSQPTVYLLAFCKLNFLTELFACLVKVLCARLMDPFCVV